jgi:predicted lipoprotein
VLEVLVEVEIMEPADRLTGLAGALEAAAAGLCAAPSPAALEGARAAFWAARAPWKELELVRFGPMVEYPERLGPKLEDLPLQQDAVEELIAGDEPLDAAAFARRGTATRGFPVAEHLLWGGGDPLADLQADPRRCAALVGVSGDLAATAGLLRPAYEAGWTEALTRPTANTPGAWRSAQDVLDEWVNRVAFTVEGIRVDQLGKPLGDADGGSPRPDALQSGLSGRSLTDARDALAGLRRAWRPDGAPGLAALAAADFHLVDALDSGFAEADAALGAVPEPLSTAIVDARPAVVAAQDALQRLQVAVQVELTQELGTSVVFNDNDGD